MIEQTDLVVKEWIYIPPVNVSESDKITSTISLDIMRKSAPTKKGLACRFSCKFVNGNDVVLLYVGEDSYVIDLDDAVDKAEILRMIRNTYSKFTEMFELRKLGTVLQNRTLIPLDERNINLDVIHPLLN